MLMMKTQLKYKVGEVLRSLIHMQSVLDLKMQILIHHITDSGKEDSQWGRTYFYFQ